MRQKSADIEGKKSGSGLPPISIDWRCYEAYQADSDMSEEDKEAFVETLWNIMLAFVDLGFGLDPTSQTCGQMRGVLSPSDSDMLKSDIPQRDHQPISNTQAEGGRQ